MKELANRLKLAREMKNVTQIQVYKDIGIHNKTLSGYERGISEPDLNNLKLLSDYYNVSVDYLLGQTTSGLNPSNLDKSIIKSLSELSIESKNELIQYIQLLQIKDERDKRN